MWFGGNATTGPFDVAVTLADGQQLNFSTAQGGNPSAVYYETGWSPTYGAYIALPGTPPHHVAYANGVWTLVDENDTSYVFNTAGLLQSITYRNGYKQTLTWTNGLNTKVTDNIGRSLNFGYDLNGLMTSMTTADGQVFLYTYTNVQPIPNTSPAYGLAVTEPTWQFVLSSVTYPDSTPSNPNDNPKVTYQYTDARFPWSLTGMTDERGVQVSTWTYGADGRVSQNSLAGGVGTYQFSYDVTNSKTTVTNPLTKQFIYSYDAASPGKSLLTQVQGVASAHTVASTATTTYQNKFVTQVTDAEGRITQYANSMRGNPTSVTSGYGTAQATTTTATWHATLNVPTQVVQPGLTTDFTWTSGQLTQVKQTDTTSQTVPFSTNGRTRTWTYTYGTGGLLSAVDGPLAGSGDTVSYTYNTQGFLKTVTDEVGHVSTVTAWNGRGQPTSVTGINGIPTSYGYDPLGRLTSVTVNPGSSQTKWSMTYTPAGDLATVTEPAGAVYTMTWDNARRLTTITNNLSETINFTRDALGDVAGKTIKDNGSNVAFQVTNTLDELGRLIKQVGGAGSTWSFGYDRTDLATTVTDPRTKSIGYAYDAIARLLTETERDGGVVTHGYNGKSEETSYKDPRNLSTAYVRDGFGDVIQETSPDRGVTIYDYDARGLRISRRDARTVVTAYSYDNAGRLTGVGYPATPPSNVTYTWDGGGSALGIGHVTHIQDAAGMTDLTYDAAGRTTKEVRTVGGTPYTVTYTWDSAGTGKLTSEQLPSGHVVSFGYDALGRVNAVNVAASGQPATPVAFAISYFPFGDINALTSGNNYSLVQSDDLEYRFNTRFLQTLSQRTYAFTDHLNLLAIDDSIDHTRPETFTYDDAQRLLSGNGSYGSRGWTYDKVGNRLTEASGNTTWTYPATSNLLTNVKQGATATRAFVYDAAGNTTQDTRGSTAYTYTIDNNGRIGQLKINGTVTANYTYDAKDRLSVRQTLNMTPAGTTQYVYDQWDHVVAETNGTGTVVRQYIWLGDLPVGVLDGSAAPGNPTLLFVHADHLKRPELMTDQGRNVVWKAVYEPFGAVSSITGTASNNYRFPGQWFQLETGLHYNWHRHYDPTLGRYTSPDPLGATLSPTPVIQNAIPSVVAIADLSSLLRQRVAEFGVTLAISPILFHWDGSHLDDVLYVSNDRIVRDGPNLIGYAKQNPMSFIDVAGLQNTTPAQPKTPGQICFACNNYAQTSDGIKLHCHYNMTDGSTVTLVYDANRTCPCAYLGGNRVID